jgi:hypothetical protein
MKEVTLNEREIRNAIISLHLTAETLLDKGKPYEPILKEVLLHRFNYDRWPTLKSYETKLELKPGYAKKMLNMIFKDLMDLVSNYDEPRYYITDIVHEINASFLGKSFEIVCRLPVTPHVGEMVEFPFLRAVVGTSYFHVSNIHHSIHDKTQFVTLWLESGQYNIYKRFHHDKQKFEKEERWKRNVEQE